MEAGYGEIDHQPIVAVKISSLSIIDSPRISGVNPDHVKLLAAADDQLPPIIVHRPTMRVIDGLHRLSVAKLQGRSEIAVRFFEGDHADAFVLAVKANIRHGLPLSLPDRKRAAERIVASHPQWSDRMVASVTGIAAGTVAKLRRQVTGEPTPGNARVGQDGRVRPLDRTEGRRLASELISRDPSLSLRQVSRAAGISPETVRDVRNRLRRGEDPLPNPRERAQANGNGANHNGSNHNGRSVGGRNGHGGEISRGHVPIQDRAAAVQRLTADPALRFSETGRNLLRLLNIHLIKADEMDRIANSLPPHCSGIVAHLARDCAAVWAEFASRVEHRQKVTDLA